MLILISHNFLIILMESTDKDYPRFIRQFVGIGHILQQRKKQRRRIELQERSIANRVIFLEKQQIRAQQTLKKKKQELGKIMEVVERQFHDKQEKDRLLFEKEQKLQQIREQNRLRKILNKNAREHSLSMNYSKNNMDYRRSKNSLVEGEKKKKNEAMEDLMTKRERYLSININRQKGRSRVDKFFKQKNKEHTELYKQKIDLQQSRMDRKLDTIKKLGDIEEIMRKKIQQSTTRVSQVQQTISALTEDLRKRSHSKSRSSLSRQSSVSPSSDNIMPSLITSVEASLLSKHQAERGGSKHTSNRRKRWDRYKQYSHI